MAGSRFNTKEVGSVAEVVQVKLGNGTIVAIYVLKVGASGTLEVQDGDGTTNDYLFTVTSDEAKPLARIYRGVGRGIRVVVTGTTARYLIVFE